MAVILMGCGLKQSKKHNEKCIHYNKSFLRILIGGELNDKRNKSSTL